MNPQLVELRKLIELKARELAENRECALRRRIIIREVLNGLGVMLVILGWMIICWITIG